LVQPTVVPCEDKADIDRSRRDDAISIQRCAEIVVIHDLDHRVAVGRDLHADDFESEARARPVFLLLGEIELLLVLAVLHLGMTRHQPAG
jgi:hypothetical protein